MKKTIFMLTVLLSSVTSLSISFAQDVNNPNDSSYPASSNINSVPNEPDHTFGNDNSVHKLPAAVPNKNVNVIYNQPDDAEKSSADPTLPPDDAASTSAGHLPVTPVPPPPSDAPKP